MKKHGQTPPKKNRTDTHPTSSSNHIESKDHGHKQKTDHKGSKEVKPYPNVENRARKSNTRKTPLIENSKVLVDTEILNLRVKTNHSLTRTYLLDEINRLIPDALTKRANIFPLHELVSLYKLYENDIEKALVESRKQLLDEGLSPKKFTQLHTWLRNNKIPPDKLLSISINNHIDIEPHSDLKIKDQQSIEREIMDEKTNSEKGYLRLEFNDITDPVEVGKTILKARQSAGLSQNQLVENSNKKVSLRTLSKLESGKAEHVPQITTLAEIAKATGMKLKVTLEK